MKKQDHTTVSLSVGGVELVPKMTVDEFSRMTRRIAQGNRRQVTKIKDSDGKITMHWNIVRPDERVNEYTISCVDKPRPSFNAAMQAIAPTLATWCDLPEEWCEALEVIGVSISWSRDIMGAVVTAKRPCSSAAPLIINAPHKPSIPYSDGGDESTCMTIEQIAAIEAVIVEAEMYLDGNRAQMELPLEQSEVTA
jgi:hypothetical protein